MPVIYTKRMSEVECNQLIDCTPLVSNSAITVRLFIPFSDSVYFWSQCDSLLSQVLKIMKKYFPFVCVQGCSYVYNVIYTITFVTSSPFTFKSVLTYIQNSVVSLLKFYFY